MKQTKRGPTVLQTPGAMTHKEASPMRNIHYTQLALEDFPAPRKYRPRISAPDGYKHCPECQEVKPLDAFHRSSNRPNGVSTYCVPCIAAKKTEQYHGSADVRERRKAQQRQYNYGITPEQYNTMLSSQDNKCAICSRLFDKVQPPQVDHDHETGKVRSILCRKCNALLHALEDQEWHDKATAYLERHKG